MTVIHEDTACSINVEQPHNRTLKVLLSPVLQEEIEGFAAGYSVIPPGGESDYAKHSEGELFCVISGEGEVAGEGDKYKVTPGTMVWCAPWDYHQVVNTGNETLKVFWLLIPPGREEGIIKLSKE